MDACNSKCRRQQTNLDQPNNIVIARRMIQQRFAILDYMAEKHVETPNYEAKKRVQLLKQTQKQHGKGNDQFSQKMKRVRIQDNKPQVHKP